MRKRNREVEGGVDAQSVPMSNDEFADWLNLRIVRRDPAAAVRFAGGEAQLLFADPEDVESMREVIDKLRRETGISFTTEDVLGVRELVSFAFDRADVLGILIGDRVLDSHKAWARRLVSHHSQRLAAGRAPGSLASCMLGHHIVGVLPDLLRGHPVSVISCRDLKPALEGEWALEDVAVYQVPSEYALRDVDGDYERTMHRIPIWPDAHAQIGSQLTVRERGEVFLVGAGVFGKDLCVRIRDRGGIAIDMGSALDRIAGKLTRGPRRRVLDLHAAGLPIAGIASRMERLYGEQVDHGEVSREIADAVTPELAAWRGRLLKREYESVTVTHLKVAIGDDGAVEHRVCGIASGTTRNGDIEPLGIWWPDHQGARSSRAILEDLRRRGVGALHAAYVDEARGGFSAAVGAVFPEADVHVSAEPPEICIAVRRPIDAHGPFPDEQAATALIYLALMRARLRLASHSAI